MSSNKPSTGRTMQRDFQGAAAGCLLEVVGMLLWFPGLIAVCLGVSGAMGGDPKIQLIAGSVAMVIGISFHVYGGYMKKKSRQVAWVREALEVHEHQAAPPTSEASPGVEDRLADLKRLADAGLISDDEYQSKRAAILDEL